MLIRPVKPWEKCTMTAASPAVPAVLQALGKSFHPNCFRCVICNETLEGQQFSVDTQNKIYCVKDYHRFLAQTCAICEQLILPNKGSNEIVRVMSMGKSYHMACYEGKSNI
ncbi:hypothetical protein Q8A67_015804 [Cirrhinus molitorella]|uniref:LIM domain-containing protein 1 n=1 Tax=Cirrhinus molitorella TaxID=172907 RepID=A0AA88PLT8_9TELE|nr:hypothetical protein Q8A67_015804 [Cirrhinus molitorella]